MTNLGHCTMVLLKSKEITQKNKNKTKVPILPDPPSLPLAYV